MSLFLSLCMVLASAVSAIADTRFDTQIEKVRQLRRDRNFSRGLTLVNQVLKEYPDSAIAVGDRGGIYFDSGQYEAAIKDYNVAFKFEPTDWESLKRRAQCFERLHKYKEAIADYNSLIRLVPNDGNAYFERAAVYELAGDKDAAKADKQLAAQHGCPDGCLPMLDQARQMYYSGLFQAASRALSAMEQRGCYLADLYSIRGRCRLAEDKFDYAAADFTLAMQIHPHDLSLYILRARAYLNMEKYDAALADCTKVIDKYPRYSMTRLIKPDGRPKKINVLLEAYRERVEAYRALGRFDKALEDCTASLREWPERVETLEQHADLEKRLKRPQLAAADYLRATKLEPTDTDAWFGLAQAYGDMKQYDSAVSVCSKYLSAFPNDDDGYVLRADLYMQMGNTAKAIEDYSRGVTLARNNASPALRKRATAYLKIGDKTRATADMKESERLDLDRPSAPSAVAPENSRKKPAAHASN